MCYFDEEEDCLVHVFETDAPGPTPRDRRCDCGLATWGDMDDLLTLTTMWELTA